MITKKHKGERLLEIDNVHVTDCGPPPSLDASGKYIGYFENRHGEQWVFVGDRKSGKAVLRGGDAGWDTEHKISLESPCPNTILNEPEKLWIITCFTAMSHTSFDEIVRNYNLAAERRSAAARKKLDEPAKS
jgi:hypothetical protein